MAERGGLDAVRNVVQLAVRAPDVSAPPPDVSPDDGWDGQEEFPLLPPGCPVEPLGKLGQTCFFLDEQRQLIALPPEKVTRSHIRNMFGRQSNLCDQYWPRLDERGEPKGKGQWMPEVAQDALMRACAVRGIFDPQGKVRGCGAHRGTDGSLVLHCGDTIFVSGGDRPGYVEPGLIGGFVYPTAPAIPRPDPGMSDATAGLDLLALIGTWNWERPSLDPYLLLGWIGSAMIGGALEWRSHAWVTGSSATGKSTLQRLMKLLFDGGAVTTADATEAALRQRLKQQTLPVMFDELEAEEDDRRQKGIIKLARLTSSGDDAFRGGQNHEGAEFKLRSSFLFSSILLPATMQQDRNRLAILELQELPEGAKPPVLVEKELRAIGKRLRKRLVDQWGRFEATLQAYRGALARSGHGGRSQDQFGTLLTCADLLLEDHVPDETLLNFWGKLLRADTLAEKASDISDEQEAVQFLGSTIIQGRGGDEPLPVTRMIVRATSGDGCDNWRAKLENHGLRVVSPREGKDGAFGATDPVPGKPVYLAIANSHEGLAKLFAPSRWKDGVWTQAMGRIPGHIKRVALRYAGSRPIKSTLIPLAAIVDLMGDKSDE